MKVNDITGKIKVQIARIPSFLEVVHNMQRFHDDIHEKLKYETVKKAPKELRMISQESLDMSINALSFAIGAHDLHKAIASFTKNHEKVSKKTVDDLLNQIETIGTQVYGCSDELGRLTIAVKKYLKKEDVKIPEEILTEAATPKKVLKIIKEDDVQPQKDEFFYVDPAMIPIVEIKEEVKTECNEDEGLLVKNTKKCFKPVLMQLKQRIVPISVDFKEREKKVLKEKGIVIVEEEPLENGEKLTSESGSDDERERELKITRNQSKFEESRQLLMSKKPFNLFAEAQPLPPKTLPIAIKGKISALKMEMQEEILGD